MIIISKTSNDKEASNECFSAEKHDNFNDAEDLVHFKFVLIILVNAERSLINI